MPTIAELDLTPPDLESFKSWGAIQNWLARNFGILQDIFSSLENSVVLTIDDFRKGAIGPTDVTLGNTPTIPALHFDATNELLAVHVIMPTDWDKSVDCKLALLFSLASTQLNGDVLDIILDYVTPEVDTTGAGFSKTSTQLTPSLVMTTANGLAVDDLHEMFISLDKDDVNNGYIVGDNHVGFCFEFHLANLVGVVDINFVAGELIYEAIH